MNTELLSYWPSQENVAACMKIDAESASEAVFLAVHQPVTFERYEFGSQAGVTTRCGEQDLLDALLDPNLSDGRVIIPVVGSSGTGKSHIVRWVHSRLLQMPDTDGRVIIRIPKGKSLKGVLGLLLDQLTEPEYEPFREKLAKAQDEIDADEAAGLLCEMLAYTLIENAQAARVARQNNPGDKDARAAEAYGDPSMLPTLLRNQRLRELHFIKEQDSDPGPVRRLVEQLTVSRDSSEEDDRKHQFLPEDLLFTSLPLDELGTAERKALTFIDRVERREDCAKVLNRALVDAKERLLGIDPAVTELFDAVRKKLLDQNKELFLLVEDFAVLSGIQKQLLQVVIKEATRDGRQILCTMRSVLAYTSGYLDTDTVLTRAGAEYRISDAEGNDVEILERIEKLVGAYLNAARIGQDVLDAAYHESSEDGSGSLTKWLPEFNPDISFDSRKIVEKFNITSDGYRLFPFNRAAIRELAYEGCVKNDKLIFNPRFVISRVLNRVLKNRGAFEADEFPPVEFTSLNRQLSARVSQAVRAKVNNQDYERWLRFLRYWGGNPTSQEDISFSPATAKAFGLDPTPLASLEDPSKDAKQSAPNTATSANSNRREPTPPTTPPAADAPARDPIEAKWEKDLEDWRSGQRMGQNEARELRRLLARAANRMITWDWDLIKPLDNASAFFQHIYIPLAPGNEHYSESGDNTMFAVCTDHERADSDASSIAVASLMAVIRFHLIHSESWDYTGADSDLPVYTAYMHPRVESTRRFVSARYFKTPFALDPATPLAQGLLVGARVLGIAAPARDRDYAALLNALFAPVQAEQDGLLPSASPSSSADGWDVFARTLTALRRKGSDSLSWLTHLLNLVGARQGGAPTVYAIDASRLKAALDEATRTWEFDFRLPDNSNNDYRQFRANYSDLRKLSGAVEKEADAYRKWHAAMTNWLGENFDKEVLVTQLKETVERAKVGGFASNLEPTPLLKLIEDFRRIGFKAALDDAARLKDAAPRGVVLSILGGGHREAMTASYVLESKVSLFLDEVEKRMQSSSESLGKDPKQDALEALKLELTKLEATLNEVCAG
jgi:hypothetical protein